MIYGCTLTITHEEFGLTKTNLTMCWCDLNFQGNYEDKKKAYVTHLREKNERNTNQEAKMQNTALILRYLNV